MRNGGELFHILHFKLIINIFQNVKQKEERRREKGQPGEDGKEKRERKRRDLLGKTGKV